MKSLTALTLMIAVGCSSSARNRSNEVTLDLSVDGDSFHGLLSYIVTPQGVRENCTLRVSEHAQGDQPIFF